MKAISLCLPTLSYFRLGWEKYCIGNALCQLMSVHSIVEDVGFRSSFVSGRNGFRCFCCQLLDDCIKLISHRFEFSDNLFHDLEFLREKKAVRKTAQSLESFLYPASLK